MALVIAFQKNAAAVQQAEAAYKQNVIDVNTLMTNISSSSIPTLNTSPPDWDSFVATFGQAKTAALSWANNVLAQLLVVPQNVTNNNAVIAGTIAAAAANAQTLQSDPTNSNALAALNSNLATLQQQINLMNLYVSNTVTSIQTFNNSLPTLATTLQQIATQSSQDANADQDQINALNAQVSQLQADIKSLTGSLIGLGIAAGVALTLGVVATIAAWPVGAATWFVLGPIVAFSAYEITMDAIQLTSDQKQIAQLQSQMSGLTADVSTLQILATTFGNFATETVSIETNVTAILAAWQALEVDVNAAVTDIANAISETSSADFAAVAADLAQASTDWQTSYGLAGGLSIQLNVNNASLSVGMTSDQVSAALAGGQVISVMDYYNRSAA